MIVSAIISIFYDSAFFIYLICIPSFIVSSWGLLYIIEKGEYFQKVKSILLIIIGYCVMILIWINFVKWF